MWYWQKDRHRSQWKRIEHRNKYRNGPTQIRPTDFGQRHKKNLVKKMYFSTNGVRTIGPPCAKDEWTLTSRSLYLIQNLKEIIDLMLEL